MRVAVFDTETTGIPDREPSARIVEVGAVVVDWEGPGHGITPVGAWHSLARPRPEHYRQPWHAEALRFNGLTVEQLDEAPPDHLVGQLLELWLDEVGPVDVAAAFNAEFDFHGALLNNATWLRRWLKRVPVGDCLMLCALEHMGAEKWPRLTEAAEHWEIPQEHAHSALDDARVASALIPHVWDRLPPWGPRVKLPPPGWARFDGPRQPMPRSTP